MDLILSSSILLMTSRQTIYTYNLLSVYLITDRIHEKFNKMRYRTGGFFDKEFSLKKTNNWTFEIDYLITLVR